MGITVLMEGKMMNSMDEKIEQVKTNEVTEPKESIKSEVIKYMKEPKTTNARNIMRCSENWYNPFYAISQTFSLEEVQAMSQLEVERLVKLGDAIGEGLY